MSRKKVLMNVLNASGGMRTPGEKAAIAIALEVIRTTPVKDINEAALKVKDAAYPFWNKQWK